MLYLIVTARSPVQVWSGAFRILGLFKKNNFVLYAKVYNFLFSSAYMHEIDFKPLKHIFVCTNERTDGRDCCSKVKGHEIFAELKNFVRASGLSSSIWVTRTGCLGFCNDAGTTIAIYPEQLLFKEVKMEDINKIKQYILGRSIIIP